MNIDIDTDGEGFIGPLLPGAFLRIIPHPHSTDPMPIIIPLDSDSAGQYQSKPDSSVPLREDEYGCTPWFPFKLRADFEATEIAIKGLLSAPLTDNLFRGASSTGPPKAAVVLP